MHVLNAFGCMVQDVQSHGSRRLVAAVMSSSTSGEDGRRPERSRRRSRPSMLPRNSVILEQPCQESSAEQPAESSARSMDSAACPRLLHCAGCAFMVDPDDAFGGRCCKICRATEGLQHSALCAKEPAKTWMKKATALGPVESIAVRPFPWRSSRATTQPNAKEARSARATAAPEASSKQRALLKRRGVRATPEPQAKEVRRSRATADPEAESRKGLRVDRRHGILEQPRQESNVEQPVESKRAKASRPSVAGIPTGIAEQLAKPWGIWKAESQVVVKAHQLTHTRPLPLPTTIVCEIDGITCHAVYLGHGQSKIVYRLPDDRVLKLCDKRNQEPDLFAKGPSVSAYPIVYASNQCTVHITTTISLNYTVTHQTWYGSICD